MKHVGYQALIEEFHLEVLRPWCASYLRSRGSQRHTRIEGGRVEEIYPARYNPGAGWEAQLGFALKHEGVNLEVLRALFAQVPEAELAAWVHRAPMSRYTRVAWFLYEWLLGQALPVSSLKQGNYVPVLDPQTCYALPRVGRTQNVARQRVVNNLPGTPAYCPLVRRTAQLQHYEALRLDQQAAALLQRFPADLLYRAAQYLYLKETKASYAIEHLKADQRRTARFVALLHQAGRQDCFTAQALVQLQRAIVEERYAASGFRDFQNYVGQSLGPARELVHYVPPKPEDLPALMEGWMTTCRALQAGGVHPVVNAAVAGFGLVFLHPFEDGNGRLHRFLVHHLLAAGQFSPAGVIFPVSATMLKQLPRYDAALEAYSREVSLLVEYELDDQGAMQVRGETARFYRYPDLTPQAEALFGFIQDTLRTEMVAELEHLQVFDLARQGIRAVVDMPDRRLDFLLQLCLQGKGRLSRAKRAQFPELADAECRQMEAIVQAAIAELKSDAAAVEVGSRGSGSREPA